MLSYERYVHLFFININNDKILDGGCAILCLGAILWLKAAFLDQRVDVPICLVDDFIYIWLKYIQGSYWVGAIAT